MNISSHVGYIPDTRNGVMLAGTSTMSIVELWSSRGGEETKSLSFQNYIDKVLCAHISFDRCPHDYLGREAESFPLLTHLLFPWTTTISIPTSLLFTISFFLLDTAP
jgi:hypothetical protein